MNRHGETGKLTTVPGVPKPNAGLRDAPRFRITGLSLVTKSLPSEKTTPHRRDISASANLRESGGIIRIKSVRTDSASLLANSRISQTGIRLLPLPLL